ncbi:helix-turn-helix transcriptional regulator [Azospirillum picis]|uniref:Transcriptional regulator with XRE-family HTH domain n=1 Tax=Azospirillum picis TaxID=488438 RepID=A0ABU0MTM0_9PROT|nr:helix-turn-helix transcriptional regulator [Azospirillum picis]MBP2302774.1 transcriptional regulator with XRE-family HTH domain [Azospirillum picis]MDQ0536564.1 transcriptional regulator with XRE-family HTH domain [Azospirillum picis]
MAMVSVIRGEVRRLREERGMKQADLAEMARVDPKTLRTMEMATRPVREDLVRSVARELGVTPGCLIESRANAVSPIYDEAALILRAQPTDDLFDEIRQAASVRWHLSISPTAEQILKLRIFEGRIEAIRSLDIVHADGKLSSQLDILAAREELKTWVDALCDEGINLLSGSYLFWEYDESFYNHRTVNYSSIRIVQLALSNEKQTTLVMKPDVGTEPPAWVPDDGTRYLRNGAELPIRGRTRVFADEDEELPF